MSHVGRHADMSKISHQPEDMDFQQDQMEQQADFFQIGFIRPTED